MDIFMIQFLLCNLFLSAVIGLLLGTKRLLRGKLTSRIQYNLWFLLLGLLAVPFLPLGPVQREIFQAAPPSPLENILAENAPLHHAGTQGWIQDFSMAVSSGTPSFVGLLLWVLWVTGITGMSVMILRSFLRFRAVKRSSLPLENPAVIRLYQDCLREMKLARNIPVRTTAFLKSPVITGLFRPCIYLPLDLVSDYNPQGLRYMLLHELQHYRYKDTLATYLMNGACALYWFNPLVWYALAEMRNDREVACDTSVLKMLEEDAYEDYGNTLIDFAEKISRPSLLFSTGLGGSMKQMRRRILNIAGYQNASLKKRLHGLLAYALIAALLWSFVPILSIQAADQNRSAFPESGKEVVSLDLKDSFGTNDGSFVLYDAAQDTWMIYNKENAVTRVCPVSTIKIYTALLGLETGIISPEYSLLSWDGQSRRYDLWNRDQTLESAMQNSVTWYFQAIDQQAGLPVVKEYIRKTGYGNQTMGNDLSSYWADSTLKISPVEQVEMLVKLCENQFDFTPENIETVKNSIFLFSADKGRLYGKTGTGEADGKNVLGWFIGFIERDDGTIFFAANIQNEALADGNAAAELTFSVLSDLGMWN